MEGVANPVDDSSPRPIAAEMVLYQEPALSLCRQWRHLEGVIDDKAAALRAVVIELRGRDSRLRESILSFHERLMRHLLIHFQFPSNSG